MSDNPKTHEWKLLKEQFNALVHNEGLARIVWNSSLITQFVIVVAGCSLGGGDQN